MFTDEATFHLSGKVNRHKVRIWGTENPHEIEEHARDSPKLNVFCASVKVYGPFFFAEPTVTGISYLDMLENYSCHSYSKIWTEISFLNKMGHPRTSITRLLPASPHGGCLDWTWWNDRCNTPGIFCVYVKNKLYVPTLPVSLGTDKRSGCDHRCGHDSYDLGRNRLQMGHLPRDTRKPH